MKNEEFISSIKAIIEETDDSSNIGIDWMLLPKKREQYVLHDLSGDEHEELNLVLSKYKDILVPNDEAIQMGKANPKYTFDIELVEGGSRY